MARRRFSHNESQPSQSPANETLAYSVFNPVQNHPSQQHQHQQHQQRRRHGSIEGPDGRRLIRRVTWRSSTYKLMAYLWVLGVLYIVWLIRDIFWLSFLSHPEPVQSTPDVLDE